MLKGKIAVITGAGRGIGAETARIFAREEAAGIAVVDYDLDNARAVAEEAAPTKVSVRLSLSSTGGRLTIG